MELLLITASKLKIVMSSEDMKKYEITYDEMDGADAQSKKALRNILAQARDQVGFDAGCHRLTVRMFPSKDGGCEMYVTKNPNEEEIGLPIPIHNCTRQKAFVYAFPTLSWMLEACRHMQNDGEVTESAAFAQCDGNECYLILYTAERDAFGRVPCYFSVVNEYGRLLKSDLAEDYLKEHCRCICSQKAVQQLAQLA